MRSVIVSLFLFAFLSISNGFGTLCGSDGSVKEKRYPPVTQMPANYKVAFIGDAGSDYQQKEVLELIKAWGAQVVFHSGDFEYEDDPELFEDDLNDVLGPDFPYFASIGNHDLDTWTGSGGHQARLIRRLQAFGGDQFCEGDYGVNMVCSWNGLYFVLSGVGTRGSNHATYIENALSAVDTPWKLVSWHKNQRLMQIGGKTNEVGWAAYDTTREFGAIIATGHEHSYCRSYMMDDFEDQDVANFNSTLTLTEGESFVFVSGLGGKDIRSWDDDLKDNEWWAAVGASDNGISDGALLCTFNVGGNLRRAECFFEDRAGRVWDDFVIISQLAGNFTKQNTKKSCTSWLEFPIIDSHADFTQNLKTEQVQCGEQIIELKDNFATHLRFDNIQLEKGAQITQAYLQVYGSSENDDKPEFRISASQPIEKSECTSGQKMPRKKLFKSKAVVPWEVENEDWERHNVWVSPDLSQLVGEVVNNEQWSQGSSISLAIQGKGSKAFYSYEKSPCLSPTLALEIKTC